MSAASITPGWYATVQVAQDSVYLIDEGPLRFALSGASAIADKTILYFLSHGFHDGKQPEPFTVSITATSLDGNTYPIVELAENDSAVFQIEIAPEEDLESLKIEVTAEKGGQAYKAETLLEGEPLNIARRQALTGGPPPFHQPTANTGVRAPGSCCDYDHRNPNSEVCFDSAFLDPIPGGNRLRATIDAGAVEDVSFELAHASIKLHEVGRLWTEANNQNAEETRVMLEQRLAELELTIRGLSRSTKAALAD